MGKKITIMIEKRLAKRIGILLLSMALMFGMAIPAVAETIESETKSEVTFTSDSKLESTFHDDVIDDTILEDLEPGDVAVFRIDVKNENAEEINFWMDHRTIDSLETWGSNLERSGAGYGFVVQYESGGKTQTLYYSGLQIEGVDFDPNTPSSMREMKINKDTYIYLDTYASGEGGTVVLTILLDGETMGNDYQVTKAQIATEFAVEILETGEIIVTGDTTNMLGYFIAMAAAGLIILVLAFILVRRRRTAAGPEDGSDADGRAVK